MSVKRSFLIGWVVLTLCGAALAADVAVLRNGNSIRHERKQVLGRITRLYLESSSSGYIEIPTDQIDHFERDTSPPLPAPASVPPPAATQVPLASQPSTPIGSPRPDALTAEGLNQVLNTAGQRNQIDPDFIRSVIKAESGFHQNAVSRKGALGLMQLMPGTASELGVTNPFDPHSNVEGGTKYLRDLLQKYDFDVNKALAAYNAGPKRVDQYHGVPPYYETQAYISRIIRDFNRQKIAKNPALAKKQPSPSSTSKSTQHNASAGSGVKRTKAGGTGRTQSPAGGAAVSKGPETASR